ncbi:hypothetical protein [Reyranella massiliensis]|uniref:hypothetical protein n=1 Tax=Reyranella massiliensis TaxID=445220 RepID=UPI0005C2A11E|nr:hypothetical protein [Reyranella massiliensis]
MPPLYVRSDHAALNAVLQLAGDIAMKYAVDILDEMLLASVPKRIAGKPGTLKETNSHVPHRRIGEPDEIAGAAIFLV